MSGSNVEFTAIGYQNWPKSPVIAHADYWPRVLNAAANEAADAQEATMAADSLLDQATPPQRDASSSAVEAAKGAAQLAWQQAAMAAQLAAERHGGRDSAAGEQRAAYCFQWSHTQLMLPATQLYAGVA